MYIVQHNGRRGTCVDIVDIIVLSPLHDPGSSAVSRMLCTHSFNTSNVLYSWLGQDGQALHITVCPYPAGKHESFKCKLQKYHQYYRLRLCGLLPPLEDVHAAADEPGHQEEAARHAEADLVVRRGLEYPS